MNRVVSVPVLVGAASRLGLRKPGPVLEIEISVDLTALNHALRGVREFMANNDAQVREAFASLQERLRPAHLRLGSDRSQ